MWATLVSAYQRTGVVSAQLISAFKSEAHVAAQDSLIGSAGTVTAGFTESSDDWGMVVAFFKEQASTAPYNVKTVNGLAEASVKTLRSGLAIASGKTFNGLT